MSQINRILSPDEKFAQDLIDQFEDDDLGRKNSLRERLAVWLIGAPDVAEKILGQSSLKSMDEDSRSEIEVLQTRIRRRRFDGTAVGKP